MASTDFGVDLLFFTENEIKDLCGGLPTDFIVSDQFDDNREQSHNGSVTVGNMDVLNMLLCQHGIQYYVQQHRYEKEGDPVVQWKGLLKPRPLFLVGYYALL